MNEIQHITKHVIILLQQQNEISWPLTRLFTHRFASMKHLIQYKLLQITLNKESTGGLHTLECHS